jgi:hypothetical protein
MKREEGADARGFIGGVCMQKGLGFVGEVPIDGWQGRRACRGLLPELGDDLIGGSHLSVLGEKEYWYPFGFASN